jgi:iron complex outermembrane receptor protein
MCPLSASAQEMDSLGMIPLNEVVVAASYQKSIDRNSALTVNWVDKNFLNEHFTGNLMQTLEYVPGIHSMDIGSGFSKPMIRGMGFNRIAVTENGIKQEGQQWGADHGLEMVDIASCRTNLPLFRRRSDICRNGSRVAH